MDGLNTSRKLTHNMLIMRSGYRLNIYTSYFSFNAGSSEGPSTESDTYNVCEQGSTSLSADSMKPQSSDSTSQKPVLWSLKFTQCPTTPFGRLLNLCQPKAQEVIWRNNNLVNLVKSNFQYHQISRGTCIRGGPEITEQSIFQDFAVINSYFLHFVG